MSFIAAVNASACMCIDVAECHCHKTDHAKNAVASWRSLHAALLHAD